VILHDMANRNFRIVRDSRFVHTFVFGIQNSTTCEEHRQMALSFSVLFMCSYVLRACITSSEKQTVNKIVV
jgi:hypothetical protein